MSIDFSKINKTTSEFINPREIFMSLSERKREYGYPRDVQTEVWQDWFEKRNEKNTIIKMNTGSGKTIVGLVLLQSCLNEGKSPAVYIVPDNYLVEQVCQEAKNLGIKVVKDENDYNFREGKAILVANIYKLVNGKSVFGMQRSNTISIRSIIVDDVHACLNTIRQQCTLLIDTKSEIYRTIIELFIKYKEIKDNKDFADIYLNYNPGYNFLVPFWAWQQESDNIYNIINSRNEEEQIKFKLPLMRDNWKTANCVVSSNGIEITLKGVPISKIKSFEEAERRIFMSATLADDSVFASILGLNEKDINNIITPKNADDIGERLIIFPRYLNYNITDEDIKLSLAELAKQYNVVVIVPSYSRAEFWKDVNSKVIDNENIKSGVDELKNNKNGLTVIVNRYEGMDFPYEACRILVIDGLPKLSCEYDIVIQGINPSDKRICKEQIQKIEQGMGRGIRSHDDYCVVILMGRQLEDVIFNRRGNQYFSSATKEQFDLSKEIWNLHINDLKKEANELTIDDVISLSDYVLKREANWVKTSRNRLSNIKYIKNAQIDSFALAMNNAFKKECEGAYDEAFKIIEKEKNILDDDKTKGLLMQYMAEYKNFINPVMAQELLVSAKNFNKAVLKPIGGIGFVKLEDIDCNQAKCVYDNIKKMNDFNKYIIQVNAILADLVFSEESAKRFELALQESMFIVGLKSSRPEVEYGGQAPDNLVALGKLEYAIIECKSRTITSEISKHDCGQLLQSVQWFKNHYMDADIKYYPIMIHNSDAFGIDASPSDDMRIMTPKLLENFKNAIVRFVSCLVSEKENFNIDKIKNYLNEFNLLGNQIVNKYTVKYKQKNSR